METRPILLLAGLLVSTVFAAEVYKWVDDDGVVHYSDQPEPGAEKIQVGESNTFTGRRAQPRADDGDEEQQDEQPVGYESITVSSPGAEETLWNIDGVLNVTVSLNPALRPGHQVRVYFDGTPQMVTGTSFQLEEVWRGVHNIQAEVLDETGKLMIRSQPNRFYVQQNTVAF
jgi:hypothetical protein